MSNYDSAIPIRSEMIDIICNRLMQIERLVELLNSAGKYDINHVAEDYFCELFNIIYGINLKNLNAIKEFYPGIDLADKNEKLSVQVTSSRKRSKINYTIKNFIEKKYYNEYDTLWIFVIGKKTSFRKPFDTDDYFVFDHKKHVIDLRDIAKKVGHTKDEKLSELVEYLDKAHNFYSSHRVIGETKKLTYELCEDFINRTWISKTYKNKGMIDFQRERLSEKPIDVIRGNNRVALLSDAGNGKTQEAYALTSLINKYEEELFAFYYKLRQYDGQEIEDLIPDQYSKLPINNTVFVLDGYDEIGDRKVSASFRKKLNVFTSSNPDIKVIVTSRTNHYRIAEDEFEGTLNNFEEYFIENLTDEMLENYLERRGANREKFFSQINEKSLYGIVSNVFFAVEIVKLFLENPVLPDRKSLFKTIIDKSIRTDLSHHEYNIDEDDFDDLPMLLKKAGFINECLGQNNLTDDEFKFVFSDKYGRGLIKRSSLWNKDGSGSWSFIHNNFGEFLAAELLSTVPFQTYKKVIGTGVEYDYLKPSWINTISFLTDMSDDEALSNWIIENNISLIGHFESDRLSNDAREQIFEKYYTYYNSRKIWLPYEVRTAISDARLVHKSSIIESLLKDIQENMHFTIVGNALNIIGGLRNTFGKDERIKETLFDICYSEYYRKYEIKVAIEVLSDFGYITQVELEELITYNNVKEEQYIRTAYFHAINALGLADSMIKYILKVYDKVNSYDEGENTLVEQNMQYEKLFKSLNKEKSIEDTLIFLEKKKDRFDFSSAVIDGILKSLRYNFKDSNKLIPFVCGLYVILEKTFSSNIKKVVKLINELKINSAVIKLLIVDGRIRYISSIESIIDKNAVETIVAYYLSDNFNEDVAKALIANMNAKATIVRPIIKIHQTKTGEDHLGKLLQNKAVRIKANKSQDQFVKSIFNPITLGKYIDRLVEELFSNQTVTVKDLFDNDIVPISKYTNLHREVANLLRMQFKSEEIVGSKMLKSYNWDDFVLKTLYRRHSNQRSFKLVGDELSELENICLRSIREYKDKPIFKIIDGEYKGIYWLAIYLAYFYFKYDFDYDEFFLLKMIRIDSIYLLQFEDSFNKIADKVTENKLTEKVIENIVYGHMSGAVLKNHMEYCYNRNIILDIEDVKAYLDLSAEDDFGKMACIKYILFLKGSHWFIDNIFYNLPRNLRIETLRLLIEKDHNAVVPILIDQLLNSDKEPIRMQAAEFLIECNDIRGLEYYYSWIIEHNSSFSQKYSYKSINSAVASFMNTEGNQLLADMCAKSLDEDFSDDDFENLYRSTKNALISIAKESKTQAIRVVRIVNQTIKANESINNIGFMNNIIEQIKSDARYKNYSAYSLEEALTLYDTII